MEGSPPSAFDLSGQVAVVSGGNSGLGLGIAEGLAAAGADVCIWGRRAEHNESAAAALSRHGGRVLALECDVSSEEQVDAATARTVAELGGLDSCFAAAGVATAGDPFFETSIEEFRRVIEVRPN